MATRSECVACGKVFVSVEAFDAHRTGSFTRRTRRCMTTYEMQKIGMIKSEQGHWTQSLSTIPAPWYPTQKGAHKK